MRVGSEFPGYIVDSIEGYLEASHKFTVLDVIGSFMNSERYPPPSLLHMITQNLMWVSATRYTVICSSLSNVMHYFFPAKRDTQDSSCPKNSNPKLGFRYLHSVSLGPSSQTPLMPYSMPLSMAKVSSD